MEKQKTEYGYQKKYNGSYGTNGFYLTFANSSAIGDDLSGNTNDWTANNLAASDVVPDSPTKNFATMNSLMIGDARVHSGAAYSEGNLKVACGGFSTSTIGGGYSTIAIPKDKKIYCEIYNPNQAGDLWGAGVLIDKHVQANNQMGGNGSIACYNRSVFVNGSENDYGSSAGLGGLGVAKLAAGDVLGIAVDGTTGKVWFSRNGTYFKSPTTNNTGTTGNPSAGTNEIGTVNNTAAINPSGEIFIYLTGNGSVDDLYINFGQDSTFAGNKSAGSETDANSDGLFQYAVPTDYVCLSTISLSEPTIGPEQNTQTDDHFDTLLWTGNGTNAGDAQEINGLDFQPDLVWTKGRGGPASNPNAGLQYHEWHDSIRGAGVRLFSNDTNGESNKQTITSFDNDGFTVAMGTEGQSGTNQNLTTMVGWSWKAGGATPTKTYKVVVDNDGANKYRFRNSANNATFATYAPTIELQEGGTYVFDWSDDGTNGAVSAQSHPIRFSTTSNGTHGGGTEYTTGVVKNDSAYTTTITVAAGAPTLYYYCQYHSGMGGQVNTNSTFGSSNFDGNIMSKVTVNKTSGFSIATFTMPDAQKIIGHGLDVKPDMIIFKLLSTGNWMVWHNSFGENTNNVVLLNTTAGKVDSGGSAGNWFRGITTTTTEIKTAGSYAGIGDYVMYSFSNVPGYQTVGSYVGNGSSDGTFVFTNFAVKWLLVKRTNGGGGWHMFDNKRSPFNEIDVRLEADNNDAENTSGPPHMDFLSNGFKMRTSFDNMNASGGTYIYLAIGDSFKYANAR